MRKACRKLPFLTAIFAVFLFGQGAVPQENKPSESKTPASVTLGSFAGSPGQSVAVPIYFTPAEGVAVGRLRLEINFVSANLKFEKLEPGIAAAMAGAELHSDLTRDKNEKGVETSTLTLSVASSSSAAAPKGLPSGLLAYLILKISDTGRPASIRLRTKAAASELETNKKWEGLRVAEATVEVVAPGAEPNVACFFFTH